MWARHLVLPVLILAGGVGLVQAVFPRPTEPPAPARWHAEPDDFRTAVGRVDEAMAAAWREQNLEPAGPAPDLAVVRRLSLGLMGTIPALEDLRRLEGISGDRLGWYLDRVLDDPRFHAYFAERLARATVGTEDGPFIIFRRRRFVSWLAEQVQKNRPYDALVREMIGSTGLWTDNPSANFVTVTVEQANENQPNAERLASRVARTFLGLRLDCAQCHDHPYQKWKRKDFQRLAAFFGQTRNGGTGLWDDPARDYQMEHKTTGEKSVVEPGVPERPDLVPTSGTRRQQLAAWVTHRENRYFALAAVNRVWGVVCGRPIVDPVDDLNTAGQIPPVLEVLADDFVAHDYDLRRLIRLIAATRAFRLDSAADHDLTVAHAQHWAAFPVVPLRPEQVAGAVLQASRVTTNDFSSNTLLQLIRFTQTNDFVKRYGDTGEDEFRDRTCTIPQVLLVMNGNLVHEHVKQSPFNAATRVGWQAPDDDRAVEIGFLAVLTRRPSVEELVHFRATLAGSKGDERSRRMEDLYWALVNSTEFKCSH